MNFIKNVLSSALGFFLALGLIFFLFTGVVVAVVSVVAGEEEQEISIKDNSVLKVQLQGKMKDYLSEPENWLGKFMQEDSFWELRSVCKSIKRAAFDSKIKGMSIELKGLNAGISQLKELREYLSLFKKKGKWITAYADSYGQKGYYLSSVADSIFVHPMGAVDCKGLSTEILFFKDILEKYGIEMRTVRHGKYKSAIEPFVANKISHDNQKQITVLLQDIWQVLRKDIATDRKVSPEKLNRWADGLLGRNAQMALENKLVDGIAYKDSYREKLKQKLAAKHLNMVDLQEYQQYVRTKYDKIAHRFFEDKIAVVYAQGSIVYGQGDPRSIGQGVLLKTFEKIKKDTLIKAVVLRINSPGGSALASDLICRGVEKLKQKKPVVVSMGNLAASGGYYIASGADYIFAQPTTITGSIGVFGIVPNISKLAKNVGIQPHRIATNKGAYYSVFQNPKKDFIDIAQQSVDAIYQRFISKVAQGRKMPLAQVEKLAQGRVWSGVAAFENKLVDSLGGLEQAIEKAAAMVDIEIYSVHKFPKYEDDFKALLKKITSFDLGSKAKKEILKQVFGTSYTELIQDFTQAKKIPFTKNIQARIPFLMQID